MLLDIVARRFSGSSRRLSLELTPSSTELILSFEGMVRKMEGHWLVRLDSTNKGSRRGMAASLFWPLFDSPLCRPWCLEASRYGQHLFLIKLQSTCSRESWLSGSRGSYSFVSMMSGVDLSGSKERPSFSLPFLELLLPSEEITLYSLW